MERLTTAVELLDGPLDDPAALAGNLRDLRRINRLLGGVALSRRAIDRLVGAGYGDGRGGEERGGEGRGGEGRGGGAELTILDVGTGGADIPIALMADARRRGRRLTVVAADSRAEVLAAACLARPGLGTIAGLSLEVFDGLSIPYTDGAFDVAHASLLVHHLAPLEATELLREMSRVSRLGVVVNDVTRGSGYWLGAWLIGHLLTLNRYTRHDAPLSVSRGYTSAEMGDLMAAAGLRPVAEFSSLLRDRYAIAAVADPQVAN